MNKKSIEYYFPLFLFIPSLILVLIFFVIPIWSIVRMSFSTGDTVTAGFTLKHYAIFFSDPYYLKSFFNQLALAVVTTVLALILGYPVAYLISITRGWKRIVYLLLTIFPMWMSLLVRIYGWLVLLIPTGVINRWLLKLGIIEKPLELVYNFFGMTVGTMQYSVPFMILTCFTVLDTMDGSLEEAARDLGASRLRAFWEVTFPLSTPGIVAGLVLAFMWGMGAYLAPGLMGSSRSVVMAVEAGDQIYSTFNWPFGSAICFVMFASICLGIYLIMKMFSRYSVQK